MASRFKYLRAVKNKNYVQQGEIYFTCMNYKHQDADTKAKIRTLCKQAGGEHHAALLEYMTTDADWRYVCDKYYIGSTTLNDLRVRFYTLW